MKRSTHPCSSKLAVANYCVEVAGVGRDEAIFELKSVPFGSGLSVVR
ncbi:MAG: hypothetical protein RPU64_15475 [Candidatus Sedimenticola sp. (ex Thyasira tokunagai)]